jgi:hypothetical protein
MDIYLTFQIVTFRGAAHGAYPPLQSNELGTFGRKS